MTIPDSITVISNKLDIMKTTQLIPLTDHHDNGSVDGFTENTVKKVGLQII